MASLYVHPGMQCMRPKRSTLSLVGDHSVPQKDYFTGQTVAWRRNKKSCKSALPLLSSRLKKCENNGKLKTFRAARASGRKDPLRGRPQPPQLLLLPGDSRPAPRAVQVGKWQHGPKLGTCGYFNILNSEKWFYLHVLLDKFVWGLIIFICLALRSFIFRHFDLKVCHSPLRVDAFQWMFL